MFDGHPSVDELDFYLGFYMLRTLTSVEIYIELERLLILVKKR
jgi:hypothetical protein